MNFDILAKTLLSNGRQLVEQWLPGGRVNGREYLCGSVSGGPGDSFRVNLQTGKWAEFSGDLKGGDLISLYAAIHGINNGEAYKRLGGPADSQPLMKHPKHGMPAASWTYRDKAGNPVMCVARYNTPEGKEFLPWTKNGDRWVCKGLSAPRPLYGLDLLEAKPDAPVLVVEGEKAAEAAKPLVPEFVVVTWPNGAKAWQKADFSPIYGRKVVLWPDADAPGIAAMTGIAKQLLDKCPALKILPVAGKPAGWDAADAMAEGLVRPAAYEWIKATPQVTIYSLQATINVTAPEPAEESRPTESQYAMLERLGLGLSKDGKPICNAGNVVRYLKAETKYAGRVWLDEFSNQVMTDVNGTEQAWDDSLTTKLMISLQNDLGFHRVSAQMVFDGISFVAGEQRRHQVRDWLAKLTWDQQPRISEFFPTYMGAERTAPMLAFGNNFWVLMVKRILHPGCQADYMVVLEGGQGIGKTRALQTVGGPWYAEVGISADSEDFERQLQGKILVEIAELHAFSKSDQSRIKQIITKRVDRYREKYGRIAVDHPRQGILAGTTNESEWIKDQTGGRRFWPVRCGAIDLDAIARDRDQLFAEAVQRVKEGDEGYLVPVDETLELQDQRRERDAWEDILDDKLGSFGRVTLVEAMGILKIPEERMDMRMQKRVGHVLRKLGYTKNVLRNQGVRQKTWTKDTGSGI